MKVQNDGEIVMRQEKHEWHDHRNDSEMECDMSRKWHNKHHGDGKRGA
jgi:hypothetical protein